MGRARLLAATAALVAQLASGALAEATPGRGSHDERVRVATYVDGEVYRLNTNLTHVTSVEFGPGVHQRGRVYQGHYCPAGWLASVLLRIVHISSASSATSPSTRPRPRPLRSSTPSMKGTTPTAKRH